MRTIKINREKWLRGGGLSYLWSNDLKKGCCLGHAIHQTQRCSWNELNLLCDPHQFFKRKIDVLGLTETNRPIYDDTYSSGFTVSAEHINDDATINDTEREKQLIKLFEQNKIKLEFYN